MRGARTILLLGWIVQSLFFGWFYEILTVNFFSQKSQVKVHQHIVTHLLTHLDSNSVSSSTDNMNRLGPTPSMWCITAPHVYLPLRDAVSSTGGNTSLTLKPSALNSLESMVIVRVTGICKESRLSVGSHSSQHVRPETSSSTRFIHRLITRECSPS